MRGLPIPRRAPKPRCNGALVRERGGYRCSRCQRFYNSARVRRCEERRISDPKGRVA